MSKVTKTYDSMSEFLNIAARGSMSLRSEFSWAGNRTLPDAIQYAKDGASSSSREYRMAEELINKVDASFRDREKETWMPSVAGAYPIVPDYLIGMPECMRARRPVESDIAPIRLIMEPLVSAGVGQDELANRGAAITALAMRMAEERPVELYALGCMYSRYTDYSFLVKVDSQPINLAQSIAVFASASFARMITFSWASAVSNNAVDANILWGLVRAPGAAREAAICKEFDLAPQDVVIQGGYLPDAMTMRNNPAEWVHRQLEKQRAVEE